MRFNVHNGVAHAASEGAGQSRWQHGTTLLLPPPAAGAAAMTGDAWCGADAEACVVQTETPARNRRTACRV